MLNITLPGSAGFTVNLNALSSDFLCVAKEDQVSCALFHNFFNCN